MTTPTPPTPIEGNPAGIADRFEGTRVAVPDALVERIAASGAEILGGDPDRAEAGRDWWPLAIGWAARGQVPARPSIVVRPSTTSQVSATLAACSSARVPVTPMAGRSGVCGGSVPVYGGVSLDCTGLVGELRIDETSLVADVPAGMFGPDLEATLRAYGSGYTLGHWPQSMDLSTVGGWLACRSAGQYSTRYGKIEDMVIGLRVVLADGRVVDTEGRAPRAATGPNLTQLFVGSEGTLGVITSARLAVHPLPPAEGRKAYGFPSFSAGLDCCRRILRRGATPAVLRLYDRAESARTFDRGDVCVLIVLDEADPGLLEATMAVVDEECKAVGSGAVGSGESDPDQRPAAEPAVRLDDGLVGHWLSHRNDVSALVPLWRADIVVDTVEVAGVWSVLPGLAEEVVRTLGAIPGTLAASVHESHAYSDGACLYFTFVGRRPDAGGVSGPDTTVETLVRQVPTTPTDMAWEEDYYRQAWDAVIGAVQLHDAAISHHHGIGLNRSRFLAGALGEGFGVLAAIKRSLDPAGILNPGKLGLPSAFGEVPWP